MTVTPANVHLAMQDDLNLVDERVRQSAQVEFPEIAEILEEIVKSGGKRLRPLILLLAGRSFNYQTEMDRLVTAAAGIELLHTASLVHDDTIDRAAIRRGKPTLNSVFSPGAVILIGDYLFAQSAILAAATGIPRVVQVFASSLADICHGQLMEMTSGHELAQPVDEYLERIYGKTASLFAGSAEMGAIIGGGSAEQIEDLREFGRSYGMAFQIVDDILDLTQGNDQLGKPAGNDLRNGTITLPVLDFFRFASDGEREALARIASGATTDEDEIGQMVGRIRDSASPENARAVAIEFAEQARDKAHAASDPETRQFLLDLVDQSLYRTS